MDAQMFQKHSKRTLNPEMTFKETLDMMAVGIHGELGEVHMALLESDKENLCEEIGDVFFYLANACTLLGYKLEDLIFEVLGNDPISFIGAAYRCSALFSDEYKKYAYHKHPLNKKKFKLALQGVTTSLIPIMKHFDLTTKDVFEGNQMKLLKRYPHGFEAERSVNRYEQVSK